MHALFRGGSEEVSCLEMSSQINKLYMHMAYFISTTKFVYSE